MGLGHCMNWCRPPSSCDQFVPRAQVQVIGVGQHQAGAQFMQLRRRDRLDGGLGAHRCKHRGQQVAVRGVEYAGAGASLAGVEVE